MATPTGRSPRHGGSHFSNGAAPHATRPNVTTPAPARRTQAQDAARA